MTGLLIGLCGGVAIFMIDLFFIRAARRSWRDGVDPKIAGAGISEMRKRAIVRAMPLTAAMLLFVSISTLAIVALNLPDSFYGLHAGGAPRWKFIVLAIPVSLFFSSLLVMISVMWFNWPKVLVAPHLRTELGEWQEFAHRRKWTVSRPKR